MGVGRKIKVLLADDHRAMCEGLCLLFQREADIEVLDGDAPCKSIVDLARELSPDVIVIDVNTSQTDNIELSRRILRDNAQVKIIVLPARLHVHVLEEAIRAGVSGFVLKECDFAELVRAVRAVHNNKTYMCSGIRDILANTYLSRVRSGDNGDSPALVEREYEVLRLLSLGMSSKEIGARLSISPKTVDACRRGVMNKLKIESIAELVKYAIRLGITSI